MSHGDVKHDYHLVNPSPWPAVGAIGAFLAATGFVVSQKGLVADETNFLLGQGQWALFWIGALVLIVTCIGWWGDVIKESKAGDHTPVVDIGLRYGMILFIASEVMFFVAWFWMFFELAIFHGHRADWIVPLWDESTTAAWANWPPPHVETFDPFHLPLMNTLILLLSGTTVTWAHHALQTGDRKGARNGLILTVLLGMMFTYIQFGVEYPEAGFAFGNEGDVSTANVYGASFFMATGFHGAHVIIGTIFLAVCLMRLLAGQFTPTKHFGLEAAAWYWHFVDVVWLFLFTFVYVMPYLTMQSN
ncbi:cytochrome c oxidase subunit 3 [Terricaulis silvestris]|uniref:cytochrome-c oxidase n=1 Tax=Terricaulis silvestris TaxID=2686094 RepID=A0A6I6MMG6_9CAUL|nr:cytochrome c oxidase subunit 3 [Terricaulis silvestris]QGZ94528.1 Cytochrome c oxidase subunit 3 [Terricaulis silvestris]